jgi:hypothetical protein
VTVVGVALKSRVCGCEGSQRVGKDSKNGTTVAFLLLQRSSQDAKSSFNSAGIAFSGISIGTRYLGINFPTLFYTLLLVVDRHCEVVFRRG